MRNIFLATICSILFVQLGALQMELELKQREAGGVGYNSGYTSLLYFLNSETSPFEFLLDLRGHLLNNGNMAANFGVGLRSTIDVDGSQIGINGFYDLRHFPHLFGHQLGAGLEWLGKKNSFRINGYLPVGDLENLETNSFKSFSGYHLIVEKDFRATLPSVEAEIATFISPSIEVGLGSYYLFHRSHHGIEAGRALGGKAYASFDLGRFFKLGCDLTLDRLFHLRLQGALSFSFPLPNRRASTKDFSFHRIVRNEIIPIQRKVVPETTLLNKKSEPIQLIFVKNDVSQPGDGSFERPFLSLKAAEVISQSGDIIYVFPGNKSSDHMDEGIVLKENQMIASSAEDLFVRKMKIPAQTPGEKPILANKKKLEPVIKNPGRSRIEGFVLRSWEAFIRDVPLFPPKGGNEALIHPQDYVDWYHE